MSIEAKPGRSVGVAMKRKEDPRFLQGKGHYVDDVSLPGMLHMAVVRSPYPHATIKSIDISEAMKVPGVVAVVTGKDLEAAGLGWLPTFHGLDKQLVLAIGKVLFPKPGVADGLRRVRGVPPPTALRQSKWTTSHCPVVADPFTAKKDETILRPDREAKDQPHLPLAGRRQGRHEACARDEREAGEPADRFQRCHPAPLLSRAGARPNSTRWGASSST